MKFLPEKYLGVVYLKDPKTSAQVDASFSGISEDEETNFTSLF